MITNLKDEELIKKIVNLNDSKALFELLNRYKPLIYSRAKYIYSQYNSTLLEFEDVVRIFEIVFCQLIKKYNLDSEIRFAGYISFYLTKRVNDYFRKYTRGNKAIVPSLFEFDDSIDSREKEREKELSIEKINDSYLKLLEIINSKKFMNELSNDQKVILSFLIKDMKPRDISKEMDLDIKQIYRLIHTTRSKIKKMFI